MPSPSYCTCLSMACLMLITVRADHKTLMELEKEVDLLVAQLKADSPVQQSKALLADIVVSAHMACTAPRLRLS